MIDKLIFVHLKKSGGMTFMEILRGIYGEENIKRVVFEAPKEDAHNPKYSVYAGHFSVNTYNYTGYPHITFLREPVERVISEFFFRLQRSTKISKPYDKVFSQLMDFVETPNNINVISNMVQDVNRFDFYGFMERWDESLERFSEWSGHKIPEYKNRHINQQKLPVPQEFIDRIKKLNQRDIELYNQALEMW